MYLPPFKALPIPIPNWVPQVGATMLIFTLKYLPVPFGHPGEKKCITQT